MKSMWVIVALLSALVCSHTAVANEALDTVLSQGDTLVATYNTAQAVDQSQEMSRLYFNVFEGGGIELALAQKDASQLKQLEFGFASLIQSMVRADAPLVVQQHWQTLRKGLEGTRPLLADPGSARWQAMMIIVREGLEAMLIIGALCAFLRKSGRHADIQKVYFGAAVGVVLSVICGLALVEIIRQSGHYKALLEGISMLLAAATLYWVGHWLLARRQAIAWQSYVREQMNEAGHSTFAMLLVALLAVFREGAETVLFMVAIASAPSSSYPDIAMGIAIGVAILLACYLILRKLALQIPLKPFFTISAALLLLMGLIFTGQGIAELQLAGWVGSHPVALPSVSWLGFFPTLEGAGGQMFFMLLLLLPVLRRKIAT